ncbi:hypothetical protein AGLY_016836 [Aphis glycines]|uniref:SCAN domain-containing protein 3 n=1 Tax=Aphis glycines TaxID=307491 RepID=A0A6G0SXH6_APHGL|nr:hypothetical protein AGLY_016836 [Aphis glycines]
MCLICNKVFSNEAMKPSRLQEHLQKVHPDKQILAKSGKAHTIGKELIFPAVKEILETVLHHSASHSAIKKVPLSSDTVRRRINEMVEDVEISLSIHCVIHRQHLVAKNLSDRLHQSLKYVISAVNKIRSNSLNNRLFTKLCKENDEEFNRLLLHTEVRWLSKGACLNRFWKLFDSVLEFLEEKDAKLENRLLLFKSDAAFMTDLFAKFNAINLQLQGDELNLITSKLLEVPQWVMNPLINIETAEIQIQEELIELSTDETLKSSFKGSDRLTEFWLKTNIIHNYPEMWTLVKKILIAFLSSYLVERGFNTVTDLITKKEKPTGYCDKRRFTT